MLCYPEHPELLRVHILAGLDVPHWLEAFFLWDCTHQAFRHFFEITHQLKCKHSLTIYQFFLALLYSCPHPNRLLELKTFQATDKVINLTCVQLGQARKVKIVNEV